LPSSAIKRWVSPATKSRMLFLARKSMSRLAAATESVGWFKSENMLAKAFLGLGSGGTGTGFPEASSFQDIKSRALSGPLPV
jgi:hypothetical protein